MIPVDGSIVAARPAERPAIVIVSVRDLPVMAIIGVNVEERERRQLLIISVDLELDAEAPTALADTVDYRTIANAAEQLGTRHVGLIEDFGRRLGEQCLELGPIAAASVTVSKPGALARGLAASVVRVERPSGAAIVAFPLRGDRRQIARFAFRPGIGEEAQRMLARFLDHLITSIDGLEATPAEFDPGKSAWSMMVTVDPRRAPRIVGKGIGYHDNQNHEEIGG